MKRSKYLALVLSILFLATSTAFAGKKPDSFFCGKVIAMKKNKKGFQATVRGKKISAHKKEENKGC